MYLDPKYLRTMGQFPHEICTWYPLFRGTLRLHVVMHCCVVFRHTLATLAPTQSTFNTYRTMYALVIYLADVLRCFDPLTGRNTVALKVLFGQHQQVWPPVQI